MNIVIRKALEKDSAEIWKLMQELAVFEKYIDSFAITPEIVKESGFTKNPPDFYCFVADLNNHIAGILVYYFLPFTAQNRPAIYMKELYVAEKYRGKKIGEKLMNSLETEAKKNNCEVIKWTVAPWNKAGQKFYEQLGARENNEWLNYEWILNKKNSDINIEVSKVTTDEIVKLQVIGRQTFFETFYSSNSEKDMKDYLETGFSIKKLTAELNNSESIFYFAKLNNEVIGYLKLNFGQSQTELKDDKALEIERIYVIKKFQGNKAGQILFEKAIEVAKRKNMSYVWLGVWEENLRAIRFYKKNGFIIFDKHIFKLGNDEQTDLMMKLELT